jgi:hypothetical protein
MFTTSGIVHVKNLLHVITNQADIGEHVGHLNYLNVTEN